MWSSWARHAPALVAATFSERCTVAGLPVQIPGGRRIRWSVIAGNVRMHRLFDEVIRPGDTVIDVGANIGYNTLYLSKLVGPRGRVIAVEPAGDNLGVLQRQIAANRLGNVTVHAVAAGRQRETKTLYLRGDVSAVNSLFAEGCYGPVTDQVPVAVVPLDDLVPGNAAAIKIDVEGAELDVLAGMPRLLSAPDASLLVEWHPALQAAAGYDPAALPLWLLERGFRVRAVWHASARPLTASGVAPVTRDLLHSQRSIELLARR